MPETPKPPENFLSKLQTRVATIREEAVSAWKSMDSKDVQKTIIGGMGIFTAGLIFNSLGRAAHLLPIEVMGDAYSLIGIGGMVIGYFKVWDFALRRPSVR